ncbi:MAG: DegV family protein [Cellulosilyticaceae bacterium]
MKIKIFSDSTSDLSKELLEKEDIGIIPLYVNIKETSYKDGIDLTVPELYEKVDAMGQLPKTAAPTPMDYYEAFKPWVEDGYSILYIGLSSKISSTFQNANLAAGDLEGAEIEIVDSKNLSSGIGLLVMKAADYRKEGYDIHTIASKVTDLVPKVKTAFIIDTLDYLYMGGRCSALASFFGGILKIRPVVTVKNGVMILKEKIRGKREKILSILLEDALNQKGNIDRTRVMVTHSLSDMDALYLKGQLEMNDFADEIIITNAGGVISSHCGANTVGILYIEA